MTNIKFTVGKTSTGFDAYYEKDGIIGAVTTGDTITELKDNALGAYNAYAAESGSNVISSDQIVFDFRGID